MPTSRDRYIHILSLYLLSRVLRRSNVLNRFIRGFVIFQRPQSVHIRPGSLLIGSYMFNYYIDSLTVIRVIFIFYQQTLKQPRTFHT